MIDGKRRKRIARGSGTSVQEVNQVLKQYTANAPDDEAVRQHYERQNARSRQAPRRPDQLTLQKPMCKTFELAHDSALWEFPCLRYNWAAILEDITKC